MDKKTIRTEMINKRDGLEVNEKNILDEKILKSFFSIEEYKLSKDICIYINYKSEINTKKIILQAIKDKKNIFVPRMKKQRQMDFIKIESLEVLKENKFGILEPNENLNERPNNIDLVVLPGLAFDKNGGRIGYGGGYYDNYFIDKNNLTKIALCYDFQVIEKVPMEKHDVIYNYLVSDKRIIKV